MAPEELKLEPGEGVLEGSLLEGLARAVKPTGVFAEQLKLAGFDLDRPEPRYPDRVWRSFLQIAARHLYPQSSYPEAERLLGTRWIGGARETLVGKVVLGTLPLMSVSTLIDRVPRLVAISTPNIKAQILERSESHRVISFTLEDLAPTPYFMAGVIESVVGEKRRCKVGVSQVTTRSYVLRVEW
jgi:uncharacterized protein (TIGR02265 family)